MLRSELTLTPRGSKRDTMGERIHHYGVLINVQRPAVPRRREINLLERGERSVREIAPSLPVLEKVSVAVHGAETAAPWSPQVL